jgi:hypothetical protein
MFISALITAAIVSAAVAASPGPLQQVPTGPELASRFEQDAQIVSDPIVAAYINSLVQNLVKNSDAQSPLSIKVLKDSVVDAFGFPGGFLYINAGLIMSAENDVELSGAIAHLIVQVNTVHDTTEPQKLGPLPARYPDATATSEFKLVKMRLSQIQAAAEFSRLFGVSMASTGSTGFTITVEQVMAGIHGMNQIANNVYGAGPGQPGSEMNPAAKLLLNVANPAVTVRGTVWEGSDRPAAGAVVTATGEDGTVQTTATEDGTFTLGLPRKGSYALSARRGRSTGEPSNIFIGQDMDGIGILLRPSGILLTGSVRVEGDQPLPAHLPQVVIKYPSGTVAVRFEITTRGLFFIPAAPQEFRISLENLDEPYFVRSITKGDLDLMNNSFKQSGEAIVTPIVITLGIRK